MTKNFYVWIVAFATLIITTIAIVAFSQPADVPIVIGVHPVDLAADVSGQLPTGNILDDTILAVDLDATNSPGVGQFPAYEAGGGFTWSAAAGLPSLTEDNVWIGAAGVASEVSIADCNNQPVYRLQYDAPLNQIQCNMGQIGTADIQNNGVYPQDLNTSGGEIDEYCYTYETTGGVFEMQPCGASFPTPTDDYVMVGDGAAWTPESLPTCNVDGFDWLRYDITTNLFSCNDGTDSYNFGGSTAFEIENSATLVTANDGEIGVDTTDDQLRFESGGAERVLTEQRTVSFVMEFPAAADLFLFWKNPHTTITISGFSCIVGSATNANIDVEEYSSTGAYQNDVDSVGSTCTTGGLDNEALTDDQIDSGDYLGINVNSISGTPSFVSVVVRYTINAS